MADREKVIKALEFCTDQRIVDTCYGECPYAVADDEYKCLQMKLDALALLKEQEKLINVDELREKLGFSDNCENCKQNARHCQYDSHFALMDFCERLDMAIEELKQEGR